MQCVTSWRVCNEEVDYRRYYGCLDTLDFWVVYIDSSGVVHCPLALSVHIYVDFHLICLQVQLSW